MLDDLAGWVTEIYRSCIGENVVTIYSLCTVASSVTVWSQAKISTIDMLHHIEMRMETLTQQLEALNPAKVNIKYLHICSLYIYISTVSISTYLHRWRWRGCRARWSGAPGRRRRGWRGSAAWRPPGTRPRWTAPSPRHTGGH